MRETVSPVDKKKLRDILALAVILFVLFCIVSLVTYDRADLPGIKYPVNETIQNKGGLLGAHLASFLYFSLGITSYLVIFLLAFWAFAILFRRQIQYIYLKIASCTICILSLSCILSLQGIIRPDHIGLGGATISLGGAYGMALVRLPSNYIGMIGIFFISTLLLILSALLATDWKAYEWAIQTFKFLKRLPSILVRTKSDSIISQMPARVSLDDRKTITPAQSQIHGYTVDQKPVEPKKKPKQRHVAKPIAYEQPPVEIFETLIERIHEISDDEINHRKKVIECALKEYGVDASIVQHDIGPTVTTYEVEPAPGVRIARVASLSDELAMKLKVPQVRVVAPMPSRGTVGIEVPNPFPNTVRVREFIEKGYEELKQIPLPILLGKTSSGEPIVKNLTDMPHLLIAGSTGTGKTVCLKSIITSLVVSKTPDELKLLLIDPKMTELTSFEDIPHLWAPVITDAKKASLVLDWLVKEMEDRYMLFNRLRVTKIENFNQQTPEEIRKKLAEASIDTEDQETPERLAYIVVMIDELADLMMISGKEVETSIRRLSQKARAVGIHVVAATQRPSADIVTGLIKSNMPSRISFKVPGHIESRIILDYKGAERLLGKGDMLMILPGMDSPLRAQCTYTSDEEIKALTEFLRSKGEPVYRNELVELEVPEQFEGTPDDELFEEAVRVVLETRRGSVSLLQRKLKIGYQRAARLVESMEKFGVVGPYNGDNPREVLISPEQWQKVKSKVTS